MTLNGKSILITGGASGIGEATARAAARDGAMVTIADLDETRGRATVEDIVKGGGAAQFVATDIANEDAVRALVAKAREAYGALHAAFNNAGLPSISHRGGTPASFADMEVADMRRGLEVNVMGTFYCMKHEIRAMLESGGGSIVNTASNAGVLAIPQAADYITAKHGVIGLTKSAALDYARSNIRVNAILPGVTRSRMMEESFARNPQLHDWAAEVQPNGRVAEPDEIGNAALWLMSDAASFVTGIAMHVDGGYAMT